MEKLLNPSSSSCDRRPWSHQRRSASSRLLVMRLSSTWFRSLPCERKTSSLEDRSGLLNIISLGVRLLVVVLQLSSFRLSNDALNLQRPLLNQVLLFVLLDDGRLATSRCPLSIFSIFILLVLLLKLVPRTSATEYIEAAPVKKGRELLLREDLLELAELAEVTEQSEPRDPRRLICGTGGGEEEDLCREFCC
ncbi:hypothetical protein TYRP_022239 [Tyrophagus putrescentiae]|nr:hypothetical protein TYRP_022239 [Tyrophagus putrescentiae]